MLAFIGFMILVGMYSSMSQDLTNKALQMRAQDEEKARLKQVEHDLAKIEIGKQAEQEEELAKLRLQLSEIAKKFELKQ